MKASHRILYVINAFENDAPTRMTIATALGLQAAGWQIAIIAWSRGGPSRSEVEAAGIQTAVLSGIRSLQLAAFIRRFRPSIVHSILVRPTLGTLMTRLTLAGRRFYWVAGDHGIHEWQERGRLVGALLNRIMPSILTIPDAVTTVSNAAARQLLRRGVPPSSLHIIPNGIDPRVYYPRSRAERCTVTAGYFPQDDPWEVWPLLGSAGNLRPVKGYETLINAMPAILHRWPKARLIIWGEGPKHQQLNQLSKELQVDHAISFAGLTPHLERLFPLIDLYIQPSHHESFGLAAAEAMCCGIPAIVSDAGGLPELAAHGAAAPIFPPNQPADLTTQILQILDNKPGLKKQGATGRGWILQNYTTPQMIRRANDLYQSLLGNPPTPKSAS